MTNAETLLKHLCECESEIPVKCPYCMIYDELTAAKNENESLKEKISSQRKEVFAGRAATKAANILVSQYREALNNYYHLIYKGCPCLNKVNPGKCESIWTN